MSPTLFTKTAILAKDKRRLSDAARSGHQRKRLRITQKFTVVTMCHKVIKYNLNARKVNNFEIVESFSEFSIVLSSFVQLIHQF